VRARLHPRLHGTGRGQSDRAARGPAASTRRTPATAGASLQERSCSVRRARARRSVLATTRRVVRTRVAPRSRLRLACRAKIRANRASTRPGAARPPTAAELCLFCRVPGQSSRAVRAARSVRRAKRPRAYRRRDPRLRHEPPRRGSLSRRVAAVLSAIGFQLARFSTVWTVQREKARESTSEARRETAPAPRRNQRAFRHGVWRRSPSRSTRRKSSI
jgi:hypothetical protein